MAKKTLEQQEQHLKALEQKIKEEKRKIHEQLGKEIVVSLGLEYGSVTKDNINEMCDILKAHYKKSPGDNHEQSV